MATLQDLTDVLNALEKAGEDPFPTSGDLIDGSGIICESGIVEWDGRTWQLTDR